MPVEINGVEYDVHVPYGRQLTDEEKKELIKVLFGD